MRRIVTTVILICILAALVFVAAPPLIVSKVRTSLAAILPGSQVRVAQCRLWPPGACILSGIEARRPGAYSVSIHSITAKAAAWAVVTGTLPEVFLNGVRVTVNAPGAKIADLPGYIRLSPAGRPLFVFRDIRVADMGVDIKTDDISLKLTGSFLFELERGFREISVDVPGLEFSGVTITRASVRAGDHAAGVFHIKKLSAGKFVVSDITAKAVLDSMDLRLEDISGRLLGGSLWGSAGVMLAVNVPYRAKIHAAGLDLAVFVTDFALKEKLELTGLVEGAVNARGTTGRYEFLKGDLTVLSPGGVMNIRDPAMIDTLARQSGQARDLISRSFTDYRYDKAHASLYAEDNKLIMDAEFIGAGGKRVIKVVLHDFTMQGGGE
jgi:hypothetical protein